MTTLAGTTHEDWVKEGKRLSELRGRARNPWEVGDWITQENAGNFTEAAAIIGLSKTRLQAIQGVVRQFPPNRRKWDVAFALYQDLVSLSPTQQEDLLNKAAEGGLSTDANREAKFERLANHATSPQDDADVPLADWVNYTKSFWGYYKGLHSLLKTLAAGNWQQDLRNQMAEMIEYYAQELRTPHVG